MTETIHHGHSSLEYRDTPWDSRVLGVPTNEVMRVVDSGDSAELRALLAALEDECARRSIGLTVTRVAATRIAVRCALEERGFRYVETSLNLARGRRWPMPVSVPQELLDKIEVRRARADDLDGLRTIAADDFHFGRFFEDPQISAESARTRNYNWIGDLVRDGRVDVCLAKTCLVGFMAHSRTTSVTDLLLGGVAERYSHLALPFWAKEIASIHEDGVETIRTNVSAASIGVMNLYTALGFRFTEALVGFHKHRS
ncbi:MAG: hypothetical protein NTY23_12220 [Chloroflexi bacterium]|nr:hypothetical protein [Chloroflexota bacterium]